MKGNYTESIEEFAKFGKNRPSILKLYVVATFYAALDEKDKAINELREAYDKRENDFIWLKVDSQLDPLRDDPQFIELMRHVGFHLDNPIIFNGIIIREINGGILSADH